MKILSKIMPAASLKKVNQDVVKIVNNYAKETDVFVRSVSVKDCAVKFRDTVIAPYADWLQPSKIQKDSPLLKSTLLPFVAVVDRFNPKDAEKFTKLVFGENMLEAIEIASKKNPDVKLFKDTLEKSLGKTIRSVINVN